MNNNSLVILQVVDSLSVGGKERVAVDLANGLARLGHSSYLMATRSLGALADDANEDVRVWCASRTQRFDIAGMRRIAKYIDSEHIDIVHTHNHSSSWLMRFVLWFSRRRPLHIVHDHHGPALNDRKLAIEDWLMLRHVDGYIAVSEKLRDRALKLLSLSKQNCIYIQNGVYVSPPRAAFQGRPTIIQVANIHWPKGHMVAIQAAARLREKIPDLRWLCIGRIDEPVDEYVREVRRTIETLNLSNCVELLGQRSDIRSLLRNAHVGALTSDFEGLPIALLEYMAEQLPVVTTDVGEGPAIIRKAHAGSVVPVNDPNMFADALFELLNDPELINEKGMNGRDFIAVHYSIEQMVRQVQSFYHQLSTGQKKG